MFIGPQPGLVDAGFMLFNELLPLVESYFADFQHLAFALDDRQMIPQDP